MIVSKLKIKLQFPYVVPTQYEQRTSADTYNIYNTNMHKNNRTFAFNVDTLHCWCYDETLTCHKGG